MEMMNTENVDNDKQYVVNASQSQTRYGKLC